MVLKFQYFQQVTGKSCSGIRPLRKRCEFKDDMTNLQNVHRVGGTGHSHTLGGHFTSGVLVEEPHNSVEFEILSGVRNWGGYNL